MTPDGMKGTFPRPEPSGVCTHTHTLFSPSSSFCAFLPFSSPCIFICHSPPPPLPIFTPMMSPSLQLAAGSATHLPAPTNWSDGPRLLLCLHCRAASPCCLLLRQQEEGGERARPGRLWTETKMNMALSDCLLCADELRLQSRSPTADGEGRSLPHLENTNKTMSQL